MQQSDKKIQKLVDLSTKKSVHVSMSVSSHSEFRKKLFDFGVSMQEVLELFAKLSGGNDERAIDIIKEAKENKRKKALEKLSENEVEDLYDAISQIDPFS